MATNSLQAYLNGLAAAGALGGTEKMLITQGGVIKQSTPAQMATYTGGGGGGGGSLTTRLTAGQVNGSSTPTTVIAEIEFPQYGGFVAVPGDYVNITATDAFCFGLTSSVVLGGKWDAGNAWTVQFHGGSGSQLLGAKIINNSASNGIGVLLNENGTNYSVVAGNFVHCDGFGLLTNDGTIDGLSITGNVMVSDHADACEINNPFGTQKNVAVVGNAFHATSGNGLGNAGFAFGAARVSGLAFVGNAIGTSFYDAIHIEDRVQVNTCVGNSVLDAIVGGIVLYPGFDNDADGIPVVGNALRGRTGNVDSGISLIFDGHYQYGHSLVGNFICAFGTGIVGAQSDFIADGNVIASCPTAIAQLGSAHIWGTNFAHSCTTLATAYAPGSVGDIVSDTTPTTLLDVTNQSAGDLGNWADGFGWPIGAASLANGANNVNLFAAGSMFRGELWFTARVNASGANVVGCANVTWDGTTLVIGANPMKNNSGVLNVTAASMFNQSGGNVRLAITATGAQTADIFIRFKGIYYKHN